MFRQIIVFTKSPQLNTIQQIERCARTKGLEYFSFNPKRNGSITLSPSNINNLKHLPFTVASDGLLLIRTSGVDFDDSDLNLANHWSQEYGISLSHPLSSLSLLRDKSRQALWLKEQKIPFVTTFLPRGEMEKKDLLPLIDKDSQNHFFVVKSLRGNKGIGVEKLELDRVLSWWRERLEGGDQRYLIQPFQNSDKEIRILCLGDKYYGIEKKSEHWKKNLASSHFLPLEKNKESEEAFELAKIIQKKLDCPCLGIDFFLDKSHATVIEINANPGLEGAQKAYPHKDLALDMLDSFWVWQSRNHE